MKVEFRSKFPDLERKEIAEFSKKALFEKDGEEALNYLTKVRGFSQSTIEKFCFGYLPSYIKCDDGVKHELAGRIVIPIFNHYNELMALSSRDWRKDANMKFWHETFSKAFYLYNLNFAKKEILKSNKVILVEGEFDVAYLYQSGFINSVGLLGTSFDLHQIALLSRYCKDFYIVLDGDNAGDKATSKIRKLEYENMLNEYYDINIIPVNLPSKTDPDDYIKKNGRNKFENLLESSRKLVLSEN